MYVGQWKFDPFSKHIGRHVPHLDPQVDHSLTMRLEGALSDGAPNLQAKDKESFLERMASLEVTLKESITHQLDAETKLAAAMHSNSEQMRGLMEEATRQGNTREALLRDQLDEALQKLRNYSRNIEQSMEAVR